jgi:hypothetical protein
VRRQVRLVQHLVQAGEQATQIGHRQVELGWPVGAVHREKASYW